MQPPRLADTAEQDYFTLREASHYAKTTGRNPEVLMSSADRVAHIDKTLMQMYETIHTRFQRKYKCLKVIKPSNPFTNVCWVSVLTTFLRRHKFWLHRQFFFCPIPETRNDGWWFPLVLLRFLFWTVNVCWAHPVISRASAVASSIFHGVIPDAFWSSHESYVWKN